MLRARHVDVGRSVYSGFGSGQRGQVEMLRTIVASALGIATAIFSFAAGTGLTGSWLAAAPIAALAAGVVFQLVHRNRILTLDVAACSRGITIVAALATLVALVLLARLTVFMVDPSQVTCSMVPTSKWEVEHSCVSAYFVASEASSSKANIYDSALYSVPDDNTGPRKARMIGPFRTDVFEYPPQFLLLPRALGLLTPEFIDFRMLWFGLNGGLLLLAFVVVTHFMGPADGTRALLLSPLVWISLSTISTLQKGNVQIMVIAASMLAMVFFERRRWWAGGALLAFVTVSKLYPGLLIVYLLVRRQWLAAAWTSAFMGAFSVLTLLTFGWGPYAAFLDHLPGLVGGEAFPALRNPAAVANNISIPGLVFKLKLFGVPGMSFGVAKLVGWVLHHRRSRGDCLRRIAPSARQRQAAGVVGDPDSGDLAQPIPSADLRGHPAAVVAHAPGSDLRTVDEGARDDPFRMGRSQRVLAKRLADQSPGARDGHRGAASGRRASGGACPPTQALGGSSPHRQVRGGLEREGEKCSKRQLPTSKAQLANAFWELGVGDWELVCFSAPC